MTAKAWNWYQDDFEEMEHDFPFGIFRPEKQNYLFKFSEVSPRTTQKSYFLYFSTRFSGNYL